MNNFITGLRILAALVSALVAIIGGGALFGFGHHAQGLALFIGGVLGCMFIRPPDEDIATYAEFQKQRQLERERASH